MNYKEERRLLEEKREQEAAEGRARLQESILEQMRLSNPNPTWAERYEQEQTAITLSHQGLDS